MKQAIIWDFHGTLVDVSSVRPLLASRDYDGFYGGSLSCPPIERTVLAVRRAHESEYTNLLLTGMPQRYEAGLHAWLAYNDVPVDMIFMRKDKDFRKDFLIKREMYLDVVDRGYYVVRAWEDSPRVTDLWTAQGIPVEVVPGYDENLVVGQVDKSSATS